jgi:hypothetical protein
MLMRIKILILFMLIVFSPLQSAFGAFPVKHTANICPPFTKSEGSTKTLTTSAKSIKTSWFSKHAHYVFHPLSKYLFPERRRSDTNGILSLIFGILGLFPLYGFLFAIPAIILGAIGVRRDERFALTGLILGIADVVLLLAEIIVLAALIAGSL